MEKAKRRKSNQLQAILTMAKGRAATGLIKLDNASRAFAEAQTLFEGLNDVGGEAGAIAAEARVLLAQKRLTEAEDRLDRTTKTPSALAARLASPRSIRPRRTRSRSSISPHASRQLQPKPRRHPC